MKTILVTGGLGFIGINLCKELLKDEDNRIICIDESITSEVYELNKNDNFCFVHQSINNVIDLKSSVDEIYNLACPASPLNYQKNPINTIKTCTLGLINVLNFAVENNSKIIHCSTSEIYGNPEQHPQNESYNGNVGTVTSRSCYDEGKRISETLMYEFSKKYFLSSATLRLFNVYGEYMKVNDGRVVSTFVNQALKNKPLPIYGDGEQTRSMMYVSDLLRALKLTMENIHKFKYPVNVGNPVEITINQLADKIIMLTNSNSEVVHFDSREADPVRRKPDISKIKELVSWKPVVNLDEGLNNTIDYYSNFIK